MKNPSVAIIVVNWNNADDTIDCIQSLQKIAYDNFKVFLIDNGSSDDSISRLEALRGEKVELVESGKNLGFSGGNNIGIAMALKEGFDYVLLLNNDTVVDKMFLNELMSVAESEEKIGIVGSKIYFYDEPDRIWYGGGRFSWLGGGRHLQYCEMDKNPGDKKPKETEYMTGCVFLIRSKIIMTVGDLCEDFFMYYEDTDWSLRVKRAGYKIMYAPASKVYHKISRSASKLSNPLIHYYHIRNALLLSKRQAPKIILPGIYLWSFFHYLKQILKLIIMPSKRDVSRMIMRGIKDFYRGRFGQYEL